MKILRDIIDSLKRGERALLATIVAASGSTPAPADSKMMVRRSRGTVQADSTPRRCSGTIGGGCLDASVIDIADGAGEEIAAGIMTFHLTDDIGDTGLNCGGTVDVLIETLDPVWIHIYEAALALVDEGDSCFCVTGFGGGAKVSKSVFDSAGAFVAGDEVSGELMSILREGDPLMAQPVRRLQADGREIVIESFLARPRVIIFGGGHVGRATAKCAAAAGFHVTVVDDREAYANSARFPEAEIIICEPFEQVFGWLKIPDNHYVVIVTRGHKHDTLVLDRVLRHNPGYIGMIGSRRKVLTTFAQMNEAGHDPARLERIHAPIGLDIGAVTPDEIGIAIAAELVAVRRGKLNGAVSTMRDSRRVV